MRVVFFEFVINYGGAPRSSIEFAKRLSQHVDASIVDPYGCCEPFVAAARQAGIDFHVLRPLDRARIVGGHGNPLKRGLKVLQSLPDLLVLRQRLRKLLRQTGASVVCSNNVKSSFVAAELLRRRQSIPIVTVMRGWYTPNMIPPYARWFLRKRATALLAVSYATRAALICSGIDASKIRVLQNPVDAEALCELSRLEPEAPLPQMNRPVRMLVPAALIRAKGQHTAVRALRKILDAGHDAVLWLPGQPSPFVDPDYASELRELADRLGVGERVELLGRRNDMPQVMRAATLVVLPTHSEGMSRAILEAMALGKPVLTTPVGGNLDLVLPGTTGLYFEVEDEAGLARCVDACVRNPDLSQHIARTAQDNMRRNFRPEQHTEKALRIFRELTEGVP